MYQDRYNVRSDVRSDLRSDVRSQEVMGHGGRMPYIRRYVDRNDKTDIYLTTNFILFLDLPYLEQLNLKIYQIWMSR